MHRIGRIGLVLVLSMGISGCAATSGIVKELAKSKRSWCLYWAGGYGVGELRISGSGVEADENEIAGSKCETKSHEVGMGQAGAGPLGNGVVVTPSGDIMIRTPRVLRQQPGAIEDVTPEPAPPAARRGPILRPQSLPDWAPAPIPSQVQYTLDAIYRQNGR